ncbi:hypothetical protein, partial [Neisseria meningitidis]|uniref:hypothetical protein n=1 Tax=Neisseria meningitidis TaxID=487 RepID=UPI001C8515EC
RICQGVSISFYTPLTGVQYIRRESGLFGFSCFWVSGNFQIVIPAQAGIQTFGRRQYSKII